MHSGFQSRNFHSPIAGIVRSNHRLLLICYGILMSGFLGFGDVQATDLISVLPDHARAPDVTSPNEFFGLAVGSRHLRHDQVVRYMERLADETDRVSFVPYATSHGGRPLFVLLVTSPENQANLDSIRQQHRQLASGSVESPRPDDHVVMYLGYGVHGDEASAMNSSLLVAYHLASSQSESVTDLLKKSVLLIDPALNPDGNSRFAHWVNENRGQLANEDPNDREHQQAWPGGRTNYYWFDLNRDWLPVVHPESRGRLRLLHQWKPNVVLDFHEMGNSSTYFFQPGERARTNPLTPAKNVALTKQFATKHAKRLDDAGELFFFEERFDDFYIGKGSTYPDVNGAIGILFEQGSSRGLQVRTDRTRRTFADSIANHVRTSLSSLDGLDELSGELLQYQCDFFRAAIEAGSDGSAYFLSGESSRIEAIAELLSIHDITFTKPTRRMLVNGESSLQSESLLIPVEQPQSTLVRSLMSTAQTFQENIFYDVSTWHLPSAFDVSVQKIDRAVARELMGTTREGDSTLSSADSEPIRDVTLDESAVGFAVLPGSLQVPAVIAALHRDEAKLRVVTKPVRIMEGDQMVDLPEGTVLVLRQPNEDAWTKIVNRLIRFPFSDATRLVELRSSATAEGPDLGSDAMLDLVVAKPALVVGEGASAYTAGSIWHHLDVRVSQPTTLIDTVELRGVDLSDYTVVIIPDGSYGLWGDSQAKQIGNYLQNGGVVIAIGDYVDWLAKNDIVELPKDGEETTESGSSEKTGSSPFENRFGDARDRAALESVAGAMLEAKIDPTHPLAFGFSDDSVPVFRRGKHRYSLPSNGYQTAAIYTDVIAGYVSEKSRKHLKGSAAVFSIPVGRGRVIVLADNPVFRGYMRSTEPFLTNAMYLGPSFRLPRSVDDE